jgi:signal transduction histidine kinase
VAVLFAVHPLHVESVAWVSERKDVLSTIFFLITLLLWTQWVQTQMRSRYWWSVIAFAAGLMSKPMLVTTPFVLLLLDWWPFDRKISKALVIEKWPFFALSILSSLITLLAQRPAMSATTIGERVANAIVSYAAYLGKTLWPAGLSRCLSVSHARRNSRRRELHPPSRSRDDRRDRLSPTLSFPFRRLALVPGHIGPSHRNRSRRT